LEQKHKATEQEGSQDEKNQIFGIFESQNKIFVDKQVCLLHESTFILLE